MNIVKSWIVFCIILLLNLGTLVFAQEIDELMKMSLEELINVPVIIASKFSEKLSDAPGVITVMTKDELERFGGTTLKDILERVPSLIGSSGYWVDRSTIATRGDQIKNYDGHNLILINGRPTREIVEGGINSEIYESFPVNIIDRIEVIKGPGSVLYGSNAFSGVINIITEKVGENDINVSAVAGDSGAYGATGEIKFKLGDLNIVGAGRYFKKADWKTNYTYPDTTAGETITEKITIPNLGQGAYLGVNYKGFHFMSAFNQWETSYYIGMFQTVGEHRWRRGFADLGYDLELTKKWKMDLHLTYTYATLETSAFPFVERFSHDVVAEWTNYFNLTEKLRLIIGGLYESINGKENYYGVTPEILISDESRSNFGAYTQMDYWLLDNLKLVGGFQANTAENIYRDIIPRAGIIWYPLSKINVKALYSQAFRSPSINEIGLRPPAILGNPRLLPEKVSTFDIGINYVGEYIQMGVNYFNSTQTDIIVVEYSELAAMYTNRGEVKFQGVECDGKYFINKNIFLTGSMLYQQNEDELGRKNITPIANFGGKAGISYRSDNGVTVSLFDVYQADLEKDFDSELNPNPGPYNLMNLHCRLDINEFFNLNFSQNLCLIIQVDNLLNKEIYLPDWGIYNGDSMPVNPGRSIYVGINASLNE